MKPLISQELLRWRIRVLKRDSTQVLLEHQGTEVCATCFCSNDYLGLATDPRVQKALISGVEQWGVGSGASPLVSGYFAPHQQFEITMAKFLGQERALFFNSGSMANLGILPSLVDRKSLVLSDKYCHASL